jgi:hypothetical protein
MIKHMLTGLAIFTMSLLSLELLSGPASPVDVLVRWMYWLPITPLNQLPDLVSPIMGVFPVLFLIPFIFMLLAGLLAMAGQN